MNYLGLNIKKIRDNWDVSQEEFGFLIGATRGMIMQYEKRGTKPKNATVSNLIKVTGISKDVLFNVELQDDDIEPMSNDYYIALENYRANPDDYIVAENEEEEVKELMSARGNKILSLQEKLLEEKEARRQETEARLKKEEERVDGLLAQISTNLIALHQHSLTILEEQKVFAAYQMLWMDLWASKEAQGDTEKAEELVKVYRTKVADKLRPKKQKNTISDQNK